LSLRYCVQLFIGRRYFLTLVRVKIENGRVIVRAEVFDPESKKHCH